MKYIRNYIKEPFIIVFSILMMLGNTTLYANNASNYHPEARYDYIALNDGTILKGEIYKLGINSFKILTENGKIKVKNNNVSFVGFSQEISDGEKYRLGILDGKRYAENQSGNMALGFFFSIMGTLIVYLTSAQVPSNEAMSGPNKAIVDDINYVKGYEKGARSKSGGKALTGTAILVVVAIIAGIIAADEVDDIYSY